MLTPPPSRRLRVAAVSYPTLFQAEGGLQIQVRETIRSLQERGVDISYIDTAKSGFGEFDIVHVFGVANGLYRVVEFAHKAGIPVVLSSLIRPHWERSAAFAKWLDIFLQRLTKYEVKSEYFHTYTALQKSDAIVALGEREKLTIRSAFAVAEDRIHVVPNGIADRFFHATPDTSVAKDSRVKGCVLNVASIEPHKNQAAMVEALRGCGIEIFVIGAHQKGDSEYAERLRGGGALLWGRLRHDDPILASAYAAAGVFCLPSRSEVMPLSIMEALAAGTPVVCTKHHGMDFEGMRDVVAEVDPYDALAMRSAIENFLRNPPTPERCREAVRHYSWDNVALRICKIYDNVLQKRAVKGFVSS